MKYILTWDINDYPESGGGDQYDILDTLEEVQPYINKLHKEWGDRIEFGKVHICIGIHEIVKENVVSSYKVNTQTRVV
jgi:hypothetical protein